MIPTPLIKDKHKLAIQLQATQTTNYSIVFHPNYLSLICLPLKLMPC